MGKEMKFTLKYLRRGKNKIKKNKVLRFIASTRASARITGMTEAQRLLDEMFGKGGTLTSLCDGNSPPAAGRKDPPPPSPQRRETESLFGTHWINHMDLASDEFSMSSSDITSDGSVYEPNGDLPSNSRDSAVSELLPPALELVKKIPMVIEVTPAPPALLSLDRAASIPVQKEVS